jgi:hypothetical protein
LDDARISTHQLQVTDYDVVVCSYEFATANVQAKEKYEKQLAKYEEAGDRLGIKPRKLTCALASSAYAFLGPFVVGFQDEAQCINKRTGVRRRSILKLPVDSWIMLSGSLAHNKWYDISVYFEFLKGHPYKTHEEFLRQFSRNSYSERADMTPSGAQRMLLQRMLQLMLVMRSADTLKLPPCHRIAFSVELPPQRAEDVAYLTEKYRSSAERRVLDHASVGSSREEKDVVGGD